MQVATPRLYKTLNTHVSLQLPRSMIKFAQQYFNGKPVIGAEIGVYMGVNAKSILQTLNVETLFLIDPYEPYIEQSMEVNKRPAYSFAVTNLSFFKHKIKWVFGRSQDALQQFHDGFFDFVYIDGNHDYDFVKKDLEGYWSKIRKGGVIGGHDFCGNFTGLCRAVVEFSNLINQPFFGKVHDFWFVKK